MQRKPLQKPAQAALEEKSRTRQNHAERALQTLGYRIDQHGALINLVEERNNALRATISHAAGKCTTTQELKEHLNSKGITLGFNKDLQETHEGKVYNGAVFRDSQKNRIPGHELGEEFTTVGLARQLGATAARKHEEQKQAEAKQAALELAKIKKAQESVKQPSHSKGPKVG